MCGSGGQHANKIRMMIIANKEDCGHEGRVWECYSLHTRCEGKSQGHEVESTNHKMSCDGFGFCVVCGWLKEWMQTLITRPCHLKHKRSL